MLRVKPTRHTVFLEADFESQIKVMSALGAHTDVLVPPVRWHEEDPGPLGAPFFVMTKVEGRVPADNPPYTLQGWLLDDSTPEQRRTLALSGLDSLVAVHAVDWKALGFDFLDKPQYGKLGFEQQLRYYEKSFDWAGEGRPAPPIAQSTLEWVRAHAEVRPGDRAVLGRRAHQQPAVRPGLQGRCGRSTGRWSRSPTR